MIKIESPRRAVDATCRGSARAAARPSAQFTFEEISPRPSPAARPVARRATACLAAFFTFKEISFLSLFLLVSPSLFAAPVGAAADLASLLAPVKDALRTEDWDAAVAAGEKAVQALPDRSAAHLWLGKAYGQKAIRAPLFTRIGWAKKCKAGSSAPSRSTRRA